MKREAINHPKIRLLARDLGVSLNEARGILVTLWTVTALNYPRGDIGRLPNDELAIAVDWTGDADTLIDALVSRRLLDSVATSEGRLIVHDWHEHADDQTQWKVARAHTTFANGAKSKRELRSPHQTPPDGNGEASDADRRRQTESVSDGLTSPSPSPSSSRKESEPPLASLAAPKGAPPRGWRRVPTCETLTPERLSFAASEGLDELAAHREWQRFSDHEFNRAHRDVDATWRNWIRNLDRYGKTRDRPGDSLAAIHEIFQRKALAHGNG